MASTETSSRKPIDSVMTFFLLGVALMIDFLQLVVGFVGVVPPIGFILVPLLLFFIGVGAWLIFLGWFFLLNVNFFEKVDAKVIVWFIGAFLEITPLGIIPIWTATIALTIAITNAKRAEVRV